MKTAKRTARFARCLLVGPLIGMGSLLAQTGRATDLSYALTNFVGTTGEAGSADGVGTNARFHGPKAVATDSAGNVYVADTLNSTIRRITPQGEATTIAGMAGLVGTTDGVGTNARFIFPDALAVDAAGNVYIADCIACTIRKMTPDGIVRTLAGIANTAGSADGPGLDATFSSPRGLAVDSAGNLYVADSDNHTIRKILAQGMVSTLAGSAGQPGSADGVGSAARFDFPYGVALDGAGNIYVADSGNETIRSVTPAGGVATVAGSPGLRGSTDGVGRLARFASPRCVVLDNAGNIYVTDSGNCTIRMITPYGVVSTLAGTAGQAGSVDSPGSEARFADPEGITIDQSLHLYVADYLNDSIRVVKLSGAVATLAGDAPAMGNADGEGSAARFTSPRGLAMDGAGNLYVADTGDATIRKVTPEGMVTTLPSAFQGPAGVAVGTDGVIYIADTFANVIQKERPGELPTILTDASETGTRLNQPAAVALDADGDLYVAEAGNHVIRKVAPDGTVTTFAGSPGQVGSNDGTGAAARFNAPQGIAVESSGTVYVADTGNHTIREITPAGVVTTLAGQPGQSGNIDGIGAAARFAMPMGLAIDTDGSLLVVNSGTSTIRRVTPAGAVTTVARTPSDFSQFTGLAVDRSGNLYVSDTLNHRILKAIPLGEGGFTNGPTISLSTNYVVVRIGETSPILTATVSEADTDPSNLWIMVVSTNISLVSWKNVAFDSFTSGIRHFTLTALGPATGTETLSLAVNGTGAETNSVPLKIFVLPSIHPAYGDSDGLALANGSEGFSSVWVPELDGRIGKATVSLVGLRDINPGSMGVGLLSPSGCSIPLYLNAGPSGPLSYAHVTMGGGPERVLPPWSTITNVNVASIVDLNSLADTSAQGKWTLFVTNGASSYLSQVAAGWLMTFYLKPQIGPLTNTMALAGSSFPSYSWVVDADGFVTNVTASIPDNPGLATITTSLSGGTNVKMFIEGNPGQVGTNQVQVVATDNDGLSTTNWFWISFTQGVAPILSVSPARLDLGLGVVGATYYGYFYLTNTGGDVLSGDASVPPPFAIPWNAHYELSPHGWQSIPVSYVSAAPATNTAVVTFTGGGGASRTVTASAYIPVVPVAFTGPSGSGLSGSTISAPVFVNGFTNISVFQFSIHWNPAGLVYRGVDSFGLAGLTEDSFGTNFANQGTLLVSWDDPDGTCKTLPPWTELFAVRFQPCGQPGTTNIVAINGVPLALEAADCALREVPVQATNGVVIQRFETISGKVLAYGSGNTVPNVILNLSGTTNWTAYSSWDGSYAFYPGGQGSYCITPSMADDSAARGVTTLDLALIRRHILGLMPLDSPFKLLAADVNGSGSVSTLDIALARRVILGETNTFPAGSWRFVPSDYQFPDPLNPWNAPASRCYTNVFADLPGQDFTAIKLGDVNASWSSAAMVGAMASAIQPPSASAPPLKDSKAPEPAPVRFLAAHRATLAGETFKAGVGIGGFQKATSAQFTLEWDPQVLRYTGVNGFGLPGLSQGNFGTTFVNQGKLTFSWEDPQGSGVTLPEGSTAFEVGFEVIGHSGDASALRFCDSPTVREASLDFKLAEISTQDGEVTVIGGKPSIRILPGPAGGPFTLSIPTRSGLRYILESSDSLSHPNWTALQTVVGDGAVRVLTATAGGKDKRFYRVQVQYNRTLMSAMMGTVRVLEAWLALRVFAL